MCPPAVLTLPEEDEDEDMVDHLLGELHSVPYPGVEGLPTLDQLRHLGCNNLHSFPCNDCGELVYGDSLTPRVTTSSSPISIGK